MHPHITRFPPARSILGAILALVSPRLSSNRAGGDSPAPTCCTPEEARAWVEELWDDPDLRVMALRHLREVEMVHARKDQSR